MPQARYKNRNTKKKRALTRTNSWKQRFIKAVAESGVITHACEIAGVSFSTAYEARKTDFEFAAQWQEALETACDRLEKEAIRRAYEGIDEPVYQGGKLVGTIKKYSDTLLIFLLKANRDKFRATSGNINVTQNNVEIATYTVVEDHPNPEKFVDPEEYKLPLNKSVTMIPANGSRIPANGNGNE